MTVREHIAYMLNKRINIDKIITQTEIADYFNISRTAVSNMVSKGTVDMDRIISLCNLLKITPNELLGYDENSNDRELLDILNSDPEYVNDPVLTPSTAGWSITSFQPPTAVSSFPVDSFVIIVLLSISELPPPP